MLNSLISLHADDFQNDTSVFEKLVRAQHHSLPTRLLDVSMNPLNALYFACANSDFESKDGVVLVFKPKMDQVKYFDSDSISCICNLSMLSFQEKQNIFSRILDDKNSKKTWDNISVEFRKTKEADRLLHFIRGEKGHFRNLFDVRSLLKPCAVIPKNTNRRIVAQAGAFIAFGLVEYMAMTAHNELSMERIVIPSRVKKFLLTKLDILGVNQKTLFPEMEKSADYIKGKFG